MSANRNTENMKITVAGLNTSLIYNFKAINLKLPPSHEKFVVTKAAEESHVSAAFNNLTIEINNQAYSINPSDANPLCVTEIWELWQDSRGQYIFVLPRQQPPRWVMVDPAFSKGTLYSEFIARHGEGVYPLKSIDMQIYVNWLANYGDMVLHATGMALDNKGYAFVGSSGVGKSTLAEALSSEKGVRILGEDQVILRYRDHRFWIFGTPWHERPELCAPIGVPLHKIFFLDRDNNQVLTEVAPLEGVTRLLQTAFIPYYRQERLPMILERLSKLADQIPFHLLAYRLGSDVLPHILAA